uniref:hypothetical protein n=1 Tax=Castellaniella defragrans TaxID=75697 RepID=UPI00333EF072
MIFCLSVSDTEGRAILDNESRGEMLETIEADSWIEARQQALALKAMDAFEYRAGFGWVRAR